jgi:hypothetical protein
MTNEIRSEQKSNLNQIGKMQIGAERTDEVNEYVRRVSIFRARRDAVRQRDELCLTVCSIFAKNEASWERIVVRLRRRIRAISKGAPPRAISIARRRMSGFQAATISLVAPDGSGSAEMQDADGTVAGASVGCGWRGWVLLGRARRACHSGAPDGWPRHSSVRRLAERWAACSVP